MIYLAADHRGFQLKEALKQFLIEQHYDVEDIGAYEYEENDDYADFACKAVEQMLQDPAVNKTILLCGSGHGMNIVADKYRGARAALGFNRYVAVQSREHDDANVLVLAADWIKESEAKDIVFDWLNSQFSGEERHARRLEKIEEIEEKNFKPTHSGSVAGVKFEMPK